MTRRRQQHLGAACIRLVLALVALTCSPRIASAYPDISPLGEVEQTFVTAPTQARVATSLGSAGVEVNGSPMVFWTNGRSIFSSAVSATSGLPSNPQMLARVLTSGVHVINEISAAYDGVGTIAVAWSEVSGSVGQFRVMFVDAASGTPLTSADAAGKIALSGVDPNMRQIQIVASSSGFVLVWLSTVKGQPPASTYYSMYTARIDGTTAQIVAADGRGVQTSAASDGPHNYFTPMACGGTGCLLTWQANAVTHYAHFNPATGRQVDDVTPFGQSFSPLVAWDGNRFLVVSQTFSNYVARFVGVTNAAPSGATFTVPTPSNFQAKALTFDGTTYDFVGASFVTIPTNADTAGGMAQKIISPSFLFQDVPFIVATGGEIAAVGTTASVGDPEITLLRAATGAISPNETDGTRAGVYLGLDKNEQDAPLVVAGANAVWAAWGDSRVSTLLASADDSIALTTYEAAIDPQSGRATADTVISGTTVTGDGFTPLLPSASALATDGATALLATSSAIDLTLSKLAADGSIGATESLLLPSANPASLAMAYANGAYVVAVAGDRAYVRSFDGVTLAPASDWVSIGGSGASEDRVSSVAIAFDGQHVLVTWCESTPTLANDIVGRRVATNGQPVDAAPTIYASRLAAQGNALAYDRTGGYLAAWSDSQASLSTFGISALRIGTDGQPIGAILDLADTSSTTGSKTAVAVASAADGDNFVLAWVDDSNGQLYTALVGTDGTVRQPGGTALNEANESAATPSIAVTSPGQALILYSHFVNGGAPRLAAAHLATGPLSGTCTSNSDCATLTCFDGFCCDRPCGAPCETCSATPGKCTSVQSADDPDTCSGANTCSANGACLPRDAQSCASASECASGFCVDGVCCDTACNGSCDSCSLVPGKCTIVAAGNAGNEPSCKPYVCNGSSAACPSTCSSSDDCARPYACSASKACELLAGAACSDDQTLQSADGLLVNCSPYACRNAACETSCSSIADCADGSLCDALGACVPASAPNLAGGCQNGDDGHGFAVISGVFALFARARRKRRSRESRTRERVTMRA